MKHKKINLYIYGILIAYFLVATFFWYYSDSIGLWSETANPFLVTIVNFITNPFYIGSILLFIELFFRGYGLKRNQLNYARVIIASIILSLSIDIVTILHTVSINFVLPTSPGVGIYFDTILGRSFSVYLAPLHKVGSFILYVIVPLSMAILSLFIASPEKFLGLIKKEFGA